MREQILRSAYVIVDDLSLSETAFRIQYFVEIRDADLLAIDLQLLLGFRFLSRRSGHGLPNGGGWGP
jgi:hypothetical protein